MLVTLKLFCWITVVDFYTLLEVMGDVLNSSMLRPRMPDVVETIIGPVFPQKDGMSQGCSMAEMGYQEGIEEAIL